MLKKIPLETCADILSRYEMNPEAAEVIDATMAPETAIDALAASHETLIDLVAFIAHALPTREAICWGVRCLELSGQEFSEAEAEAVDTARAWVLEPAEHHRLKCQQLAEALGTDGAAGWLCLAVNWNGSGSIVPPDDPVVMPAPYLHAKALIGVVGLVAGADPDERHEFSAKIRGAGIEIANGAWPIAAPQTAGA